MENGLTLERLKEIRENRLDYGRKLILKSDSETQALLDAAEAGLKSKLQWEEGYQSPDERFGRGEFKKQDGEPSNG